MNRSTASKDWRRNAVRTTVAGAIAIILTAVSGSARSESCADVFETCDAIFHEATRGCDDQWDNLREACESFAENERSMGIDAETVQQHLVECRGWARGLADACHRQMESEWRHCRDHIMDCFS
jgi:hypothetical protein